MLRQHTFDPQSGAPVKQKEYPPGVRAGRDQGRRLVVEHPFAVTDDWVDAREGSMTNGELVSSADGLLGYFRQVHRRVREADPDLDRAAAAAIRAVRRTDSGRRAADTFVWYTVAERLARNGHWVAWMLDQCIPRCPHCRSELKFRGAAGNLEGVCASAPNRHGAVDGDIRERIHSLYSAAFDAWLDADYDATDPLATEPPASDAFMLF
jgi:hypothetical protein